MEMTLGVIVANKRINKAIADFLESRRGKAFTINELAKNVPWDGDLKQLARIVRAHPLRIRTIDKVRLGGQSLSLYQQVEHTTTNTGLTGRE